MSTDAVQIHDAIEQLLLDDALFRADMEALGLSAHGQAAHPKIIKAFRPAQQIDASKLPAFVLEKGNSSAAPLANAGSEHSVIGFQQQGMSTDVFIGLAWHQQEHEKAYEQRLGIERAFIQLFLRHPDPGGAVMAWVSSVEFDRGALHPRQTALVTVTTEYAVRRSA